MTVMPFDNRFGSADTGRTASSGKSRMAIDLAKEYLMPTKTANDDRDAVMILTDEHRELQHMIGVLTDAGIGDARNLTALVDEMVIELARHLSATERCLHPAVREHVVDGAVMVGRLDKENVQVRLFMKAVTGRTPSEPEFGPTLTRLTSAVRAHIADEEASVFPRLAAACTPHELRELGVTVLAVERVAPTRSHPHAPHVPPMNAISERALGLIDKARDRIGRRGSDDGA